MESFTNLSFELVGLELHAKTQSFKLNKLGIYLLAQFIDFAESARQLDP